MSKNMALPWMTVEGDATFSRDRLEDWGIVHFHSWAELDIVCGHDCARREI